MICDIGAPPLDLPLRHHFIFLLFLLFFLLLFLLLYFPSNWEEGVCSTTIVP